MPLLPTFPPPPPQALKYEWRHDSPLARLLLRMALTNKHFGNLLFWWVGQTELVWTHQLLMLLRRTCD